jgi:hypothetical protein
VERLEERLDTKAGASPEAAPELPQRPYADRVQDALVMKANPGLKALKGELKGARQDKRDWDRT